MDRRGRRRGFERPLSTNQIIAWVGNALATGLFYSINAVVLFTKSLGCNPTPVAGLLLCHLAASAGGFGCWMFLETHQPCQESCFGRLLPDTTRWTKVRYCREHKATISGLDHFCTWLNVSVGRSNYIPFYCLSLFGVIQYSLHVIICIYLLVDCASAEISSLIRILFGVLALAGFLILLAYAALWAFHTYLCWTGLGTYDWILRQREAPSVPMTKTAVVPTNDPEH
ncbi:hypothetical protein M885DRAFT_506899 [Pelagophyceae sp. CCMP2097]|nr:hypothetical protein M885DRAFT_506899 [Pelagophyceae sp. CCMP2097]